MSFDEIFAAYYNLFRGEADIPDSNDEEYTIALRLANEAVNRWAFYDNTMWQALFTTAQVEGDGDLKATAATEYDAPGNFQEAGGQVWLKDSDGNIQQQYPIIDPSEAQFQPQMGTYCYFTGSPNGGYTLHLNPAPSGNLVGMNIDYVYYKQPTQFDDGDTVTECPDPYFVINRMLAQQFRINRNPYYSSALNDAENALKQMKMTNDSGTWGNPWQVKDRSGGGFGR